MSEYHYTECGLQNVFIKGLEPVKDADGDLCIEIPAVNYLHNAIAEGIIRHPSAMSGAELRFLRTEMGYTQVEISGLIHAERQTIGGWERGKSPIDPLAETVIRQLAIEKLLITYEEGLEKLVRSTKKGDENQPINIQADDGRYELIAA